MSNWVAPIKLSADIPRRVKMKTGYYIVTVSTIIVAMVGISIVPMTVIFRYHKYEAFKERGVTVTGIWSSGWITSGKGGKVYHVSYRYNSEINAGPVMVGDDVVSSYYFNSHKSGDGIPVIYDPLKPTRSMINIIDVGRARDPSDELQSGIEVSLLAIFFSLVVAGIFIWPYMRERRLLKWGKVAPATILAEEEYRVKAGRASKVTYQFVDDTGNTVRGKQKGVPAKDTPGSGAVESRARFFRSPTVLFDPRNSGKSILYPPLVAELR